MYILVVAVIYHSSFPLNLVCRAFGSLHVRYYTRACACPFYVSSYISFGRFVTSYVLPAAIRIVI